MFCRRPCRSDSIEQVLDDAAVTGRDRAMARGDHLDHPPRRADAQTPAGVFAARQQTTAAFSGPLMRERDDTLGLGALR